MFKLYLANDGGKEVDSGEYFQSPFNREHVPKTPFVLIKSRNQTERRTNHERFEKNFDRRAFFSQAGKEEDASAAGCCPSLAARRLWAAPYRESRAIGNICRKSKNSFSRFRSSFIWARTIKRSSCARAVINGNYTRSSRLVQTRI